MSNRICKKCKSRKVVVDGHYAGSTFYKCENCKEVGMQDNFPKQTLFDQITELPESLAEKLVFEIFCKEDPNIKGWTSAFTDVHETKEQAIAATVAKLKEVQE